MTTHPKRLATPAVLLLLAFAACGPAAVPPVVSASVPASGAMNVARDARVTAKFNREMEAATLNANTFILKAGSAVIAGGVSYADLTATFTPSAPLGAD